MRILIICPHLSTGGQPMVALKRVESLIKNNEVYLIEYRQIAWSFVVQRNRIISLLGDNFISLGNVWDGDESIRDNFINIVKDINPDIIHMEEIPEIFSYGMSTEHSDWLYREDRTYKIIETTHTSTFNVDNKKYYPDKFLFVSKYSYEQYKKLNISSSILEYPIEKLERNKSLSIKKLHFDPDYFHVLNVGLFTSGKNQGYVFDIAKKLEDYKIIFHFVGNQAGNFSEYWEPLLERKLDNCIIHGERDDVDLFYQASDLLIHPSTLELNPLAVKEATSYDLPVYLNRLSTYLDTYDSYSNIKYLTMNIDKDSKRILDNFNIKRKDDNIKFEKLLISEYENVMNIEHDKIETEDVESVNIVSDSTESLYTYNIDFNYGAKVEILGNGKQYFDVEIVDKNSNNLIYKSKITNNSWCTTNNKCFKEYKINIFHNNELLVVHNFDLLDKNVLIKFESKSIGDTIAWFPYVEEFRKKHNCNVYCSTFWNSWFENEYPYINFIKPGNSDIKNLYASYSIGWFSPFDVNKNPIDYKKIPLQKTASDILGLEYKEISPKIYITEEERTIKEKYVCIGQFSTANAKHWHYPYKDSNKGWQILVDWLNEQGYKVMVISKQPTKLKNIIDKTGDFPIEQRINDIKHSEFYIGVGSGLSWLSWAIGKKVVMISGFSNPICEFKNNIINVHNFNVCNGCFNKHIFDRADWNWCPEHKNSDKQFECSINITPKMVVDRIISSKLIEDVVDFDFDKYLINCNIKEEDIKLDYNKNENKFIIQYIGDEKMTELNVDIKDFYTNECYYTLSDVLLSNKYVVWCKPTEKICEKTDKLNIVFYMNKKLCEVQYDF